MKEIEIPQILDDRGNLSFLQEGLNIPFQINRVYWIYDVPGGEVRGGHAYHNLQEIIIALSGSFDVLIDDGYTKNKITLNRSYKGVLIPNLIWRQLENFSTNAVALVIASTEFQPNDYIRDYEDFQKIVDRKEIK